MEANPSEALKLAELLECDLQATNDLVTRTINGYDYLDILETIKQALLKAQELEKENKVLKACIRDWEDDYKHLEYALHKAQVRMELTAFEIIKEKGIDIGWLRQCNTVEEYNYHCEAKLFTEEEFNLLKEVLE